MQYSLFTHGTALQIESPAALAGSLKVGWGTRVAFRAPVGENAVFPAEGPGSWLHIALPSTLTTFGRKSPELKSVTLLFDATHCRILHVHVYDGFELVEEFNDFKLPRTTPLKGQFLTVRNSDDVNPELPSTGHRTFRNTLELKRPHRVFSSIGISFYACAFFEDFNEGGFATSHPPFPESILTVSAAGGQFVVADDFNFFSSVVGFFDRITRRGP